MTDTDKHSTMRRKAGAGRPPPEIGRPSPARALRAAVAQAAEDAAGLIAQALQVDERRIAAEAFAAQLPDHPLLALCEGSEGRFGVALLDNQLLAALIEMQTTGRVVPKQAPPRAPTKTDAILAADFIDQVLEQFERSADEAGLEIAASVTGYRYAMPLSDARAMLMTLDDIPYRLFDLTLDLDSGAKSGGLQLLLPYQAAVQNPGVASAGWDRALHEVVGCAAVELHAVLARPSLPLHTVTGFAPGQTIPLARDVIGQVRIEDGDHRPVSGGRLGQANGHRAVCISPLCTDTGDAGPDPAGAGMPAPGPFNTAPPATIASPEPEDRPDDLADIGAVPDLPDLPPAGDLPDLPKGDTPDGDLPDLASLGDLGVLSDNTAEPA